MTDNLKKIIQDGKALLANAKAEGRYANGRYFEYGDGFWIGLNDLEELLNAVDPEPKTHTLPNTTPDLPEL